MKRLYVLLFLSCFLSSCTVNRYYYIAEEKIPLYEFDHYDQEPLLFASVGDTLAATGTDRVQLGGPIPIDYKGYRFYSPSAKARFLRSAKVNPKKNKVLPATIYATRMAAERESEQALKSIKADEDIKVSTPSYSPTTQVGPREGRYYQRRPTKDTSPRPGLSNGFGIGFGFSTERALCIDLLYRRSRNMYGIGFINQYNGQLGTLKGSRLANYGTTVTGSNTYFTAILGEFDYWLTNRVAIGISGAIGTNSSYRNYSDKRFKSGGYHMISNSELAYGFGGRLDYMIGRYFMASGGYNTLTGGNLSLSIVTFGLD